ncbi:MAG TPA: c-type cytochrome [Gemmatimonadota bacterium]|nr:c-type cytochrome [Gemmatimonadota bacterium]
MGSTGNEPNRKCISLACAGLLLALASPVPRTAAAQEPSNGSLTDTIPPAELARMIEAGSDLFNGGSCTVCHGVGGRGDDRRAPDLTDPEWLHGDGSFERILRTIVWGVERDEMKAVTPRPFEMFPLGGMSLPTNDERRALAAYVWSLSSLGPDEAPPRVSAQNEFLDLLERGEAGGAMALFEQQRRSAPEALLFGESAINRLGYKFLQQMSQPRTAIEIFELNTELHPESWNVWDSLAEGHMVAGDRERAIELYERSLELNPENDNAREKLAELRRS